MRATRASATGSWWTPAHSAAGPRGDLAGVLRVGVESRMVRMAPTPPGRHRSVCWTTRRQRWLRTGAARTERTTGIRAWLLTHGALPGWGVRARQRQVTCGHLALRLLHGQPVGQTAGGLLPAGCKTISTLRLAAAATRSCLPWSHSGLRG